MKRCGRNERGQRERGKRGVIEREGWMDEEKRKEED